MLNAGGVVAPEHLSVLEGVEMEGRINVSDETLRDNIASAIRRQHPQIRPQGATYDRIALVGGGPSLEATLPELVQAIQEGAKLVTVNGAYHWCLERNLIPKTQIVMDARPCNARFVEPAVPGCRYVLASQCAPQTWDMVAGRDEVWIFHAVVDEETGLSALLDQFYAGQWFGVGGGITVVSRAISLLRMVGYLRMDLFGVDCCFLNGQHHAYAQPENDRDRPFPFRIHPTGHPERAAVFQCAPWHVKQFEGLIQAIKINGQHFMLNVHGDGLLAYALRTCADLAFDTETGETHVSTGV